MEGLEFYHNIEKKNCQVCESKIEEQADCYINVCDVCLPEVS